MLHDIFKPLTKLFGVAPRSGSLRLWPDTLFRPRTIYARTKRRMQNGLNDAPVLVHEPVRTKSLSSTNRGSPRTSAQIITMFADRGTRH